MEGSVLCSSCKMSSINAVVPTLAFSSRRSLEIPHSGKLQFSKPGLALPCLRAQSFQQRLGISHARRRLQSTAFICAAMSARCAAEQTQTVTRQSSTITIAPIQGKEKSPEIDDGGTGFPPRDDDGDGGGGGGGGGPQWSGGFFFFGLLAFLGFMKDKESEGPYKNERRR